MRGKLLLLAGLGVGYYFGAKAGRSRYRQIRRIANTVWTSKPVQNKVSQAEDFVRGVAPEIVEKVEQGSRFVGSLISSGAEETGQDQAKANVKSRGTQSNRKTVASRGSAQTSTSQSAANTSRSKPKSSTTESSKSEG